MLATTGSCAELEAPHPTDVDGEYALYAAHDDHRPFTAYCKDMATSSPKEYLTLHNTAPGANYSEELAGGAISGTNVVRTSPHRRARPGSRPLTRT